MRITNKIPAQIPKNTKKLIKKEVSGFINNTVKDKSYMDFTRVINPILALIDLSLPINDFLIKDVSWGDGVFLLLSLYFAKCAEKTHVNALVKSQEFVKVLEDKGFGQKEKVFGIKQYLTKTGCPVFSNLFKLNNKKYLQKLANGAEIV